MSALRLKVACRTFASVVGLAAACAVYGQGSGQQYGPFDYYKPGKGSVALVERFHMGPRLEQHVRNKAWCAYWYDVDYTLRAFPNHPTALTLMAEHLKHHSACSRRTDARRSTIDLMREIESSTWREKNADYYFETAIEFRPEYAATRVLYGRYLASVEQHQKAIAQYEEAIKREPKSADAHYEVGLLYFAQKDYAKAKSHAQQAYDLGQSQTELKEKLAGVGHWSRP